VAICFPHHYAPWTRKKLIFILIIMAWLIALVLKMLNFVGIGGSYVATNLGMCVYVGKGRPGHAILAMGGWVTYLLVGLIAAAILLHSMVNTVKNRQLQTVQSPSVKRRLSVAKMLFVSFLFSLICNLPVSILMSNGQFVTSISPLTALWLRFLFVGPLAVNPVSAPARAQEILTIDQFQAPSAQSVTLMKK
jgi:Serpentine type 7TM GPCR chemoreceptor Srv